MSQYKKHFTNPAVYIIHHITQYTTTALAVAFTVTPLTPFTNAGDKLTDKNAAWKSTNNHYPTTIQDFGSITTQSTNPDHPFRLRARAGVWFAVCNHLLAQAANQFARIFLLSDLQAEKAIKCRLIIFRQPRRKPFQGF